MTFSNYLTLWPNGMNLYNLSVSVKFAFASDTVRLLGIHHMFFTNRTNVNESPSQKVMNSCEIMLEVQTNT